MSAEQPTSAGNLLAQERWAPLVSSESDEDDNVHVDGGGGYRMRRRQAIAITTDIVRAKRSYRNLDCNNNEDSRIRNSVSRDSFQTLQIMAATRNAGCIAESTASINKSYYCSLAKNGSTVPHQSVNNDIQAKTSNCHTELFQSIQDSQHIPEIYNTLEVIKDNKQESESLRNAVGYCGNRTTTISTLKSLNAAASVEEIFDTAFSVIMTVLFTWQVVLVGSAQKRFNSLKDYGTNLATTVTHSVTLSDHCPNGEHLLRYESVSENGDCATIYHSASASNYGSNYSDSHYFSLEDIDFDGDISTVTQRSTTTEYSTVSDLSSSYCEKTTESFAFSSDPSDYSIENGGFDDTIIYSQIVDDTNDNISLSDFHNSSSSNSSNTSRSSFSIIMSDASRAENILQLNPKIGRRDASEDHTNAEFGQTSTTTKSSAASLSPTSTANTEEDSGEESERGKARPQHSGISHLLETDAPLTTSNEGLAGSHSPPPIFTQGLQQAKSSAETKDSPPIVVETIGVKREAARAAANAEWRQHYAPETSDAEVMPPPNRRRHFIQESEERDLSGEQSRNAAYLYFGESVQDYGGDGEDEIGGGLRARMGGVGVENIPIPPLGFLDAIVEEESDDLRSAQSSRASSLHHGHLLQRDSTRSTDSSVPKSEVDARFEQLLRRGKRVDGDANSSSSTSSSESYDAGHSSGGSVRIREVSISSEDSVSSSVKPSAIRTSTTATTTSANFANQGQEIPRLDFASGISVDTTEGLTESDTDAESETDKSEAPTTEALSRDREFVKENLEQKRAFGEGSTTKKRKLDPTESPQLEAAAETQPQRSQHTAESEKVDERPETELRHSASSNSINSTASEIETVLESSTYGNAYDSQPLEKVKELEKLEIDAPKRAKYFEKDDSPRSSLKSVKQDLSYSAHTTASKPHVMFDADRDQMEVFVPMSDQQYSCATPLEDGQVSSTSMSLNLDRSRDDLDESVCSNPHGDGSESVAASAAQISSMETPCILPILQRDNEFEKHYVNSSVFPRSHKKNDEEDEESLPLPPPPPPPIDYEIELKRKLDDDRAASVASEIAESVVKAAIRELNEQHLQQLKQQQQREQQAADEAQMFEAARVEESQNTPDSEKSEKENAFQTSLPNAKELEINLADKPQHFQPVRPLSGRTERIASYIYGNESAVSPLAENVGAPPTKVIDVPIVVKSRPTWRSDQPSPTEDPNKENWRNAQDRQRTVYASHLTPRVDGSGSDYYGGSGRNSVMERIVPIRRYLPLSVDATDANNKASYTAYISPKQTFQSYEMRRRRHNSEYRMSDILYKDDPPHLSSQPQERKNIGSDFTNVDEFSRDDLMSAFDAGELNSRQQTESQFQRSSRSTVRDIPIQRSTSAFAPSSSSYLYPTQDTHHHHTHHHHLPYSSTSHQREMSGFSCGGPLTTSALPGNSSSIIYSASKFPSASGTGPHEEYYRKEVLTRTLVTRSTEALSAPPPLGRSSPIITDHQHHFRQLPEPPQRDEVSEEYWYKYSRNIEEEERRIRENQEKRQKEEEERRIREEELRRRWEQQELEHLERLRLEREKMEKDLEQQILERDRIERERIERDRIERENMEMLRRQEWERFERERRQKEELELQKHRELERLEKERLERERLERERLEIERLERERLAQEKLEKERVERERIERERIEIERLEIERIERIKRERREKDEKERERQRAEAERLERERIEAERIERERIELERKERELLEIQRREAEQRERERREDELREQRRRQQEQRERELLEQAEREAAEREMQRKYREKMEQERIENLRREQERLEFEKAEAERRERQRQEDERREQELIDAQIRARDRREQERLEECKREALRQEEERREQERRQRERLEAQERERLRAIEEQKERERVAALEAAAAERRAQRLEEERLQRNRTELERRAEELKEMERREAEKREKERLEEERRLAELRELERRNAEQREAERREAAERESNRRRDDRRSRDRLDIIMKEREEHERWENERKRVLAEHEAQERRRQALTSKETLERLTRKPYFSRENLSNIGGQPEVTTKIERQIIERVDRTLYTSDETRHYPPERGTSAPLSDRRALPLPPPPPLGMGNGSSSVLDHRPSPTSDYEYGGAARERIYNPRDDELRRGGSTRTSKYKARMEKARKEFLSHANPPPSDFQSDPISDRFRKSTEDLRRRVDYRGPLLQKFHNGEMSRNDFDLPSSHALPYSRIGASPYEHEFRRLFAKAERSLGHYRHRRGRQLSQPDLRARYASTSSASAPFHLAHETNLDDVHRSKSVLDYDLPHYRQSRKDVSDGGAGVGVDPFDASQHSRSKSADYVMDRRIREDVAAPENELQKSEYNNRPGEDYTTTSHQREVSEHEMRFRKSVEKLPVPDWYREHGSGAGFSSGVTEPYGRPATATTSGIFSTSSQRPAGSSFQVSPNASPNVSGTALPPQRYTVTSTMTPTPSHARYYSGSAQHQPWSYTEGARSGNTFSPATSPPIGGISFPAGMFDKYKDEIEDLRRSRTSLHQIGGPQEHAKDTDKLPQKPLTATETITREYSREAFSKTDIRKITNGGGHQPGYTVSTVPTEWNLPRDRNSRVIEVADTFVGRPEIITSNNRANRFGGRITIEEVLDSIFQETQPNADPNDPSFAPHSHSEQPAVYDPDGPCIFTPNTELMRKIIEDPQLIETHVDKNSLNIRCARCSKTRSLRDGRTHYFSCKHCYKYYCSRDCRHLDWERHRDRCSFARINTLCKEVIMKVRRDHETQFQMSKVAREGFSREGRGSVNIRLMWDIF